MAKYSSKPQIVNIPADELASKFADFTLMQSKLDALPAEERERVGEVSFTKDSIIINTAQVGQIKLTAVERTPAKVVLKAENSPVPMAINVLFNAVDTASSEVLGEMEVEIPMMLRPMVGPVLQKAVDQFGTLFARLA